VLWTVPVIAQPIQMAVNATTSSTPIGTPSIRPHPSTGSRMNAVQIRIGHRLTPIERRFSGRLLV
jgi:hypothetical protein